MRILMTVSSTSLMDGIDRHILAIAPALNALPDVEVGVVTLHSWGDVNDALKAAGVKCWSLECANGHQLTALPRFCRVMREFNPDVIHGHVTAFFESVALKWLYPRVKRVVTIHGISDPVVHVTWRMRLTRLLGVDMICNFFANKKPDAYVSISQGVLSAYPGFQAAVIYNPMKFGKVSRPPSKESRRVIGTACRVEEVKDPLAFTRVMGEVTKRIPDSEAWIIGEGDRLESCRQLAEAHGYTQMRFWGRRNDAKDLIAQMDCFVLTSHREGMPGALLEAMSVKTPVAFMAGEGGLQDLAEMNRTEGPFAVVVSPGDEGAMVEGICDLLANPEKMTEYAERAFDVGRRHFDLSVVARQLHEVYTDVLGNMI